MQDIDCVWYLFSILTERCTLLSSSNDLACSCEQFNITNVDYDVIAKLWTILKLFIFIVMFTYVHKVFYPLFHAHSCLLVQGLCGGIVTAEYIVR